MMVNKPRKEAYKNFYANYDAEAEFQRMKVRSEESLLLINWDLIFIFQACGIFQSQAIIEEKMAEMAEEGGDEAEADEE